MRDLLSIVATFVLVVVAIVGGALVMTLAARIG
jgi:hypothetical protein